jgi:hypothetical protein
MAAASSRHRRRKQVWGKNLGAGWNFEFKFSAALAVAAYGA